MKIEITETKDGKVTGTVTKGDFKMYFRHNEGCEGSRRGMLLAFSNHYDRYLERLKGQDNG